jgi:hypothetical protein
VTPENRTFRPARHSHPHRCRRHSPLAPRPLLAAAVSLGLVLSPAMASAAALPQDAAHDQQSTPATAAPESDRQGETDKKSNESTGIDAPAAERKGDDPTDESTENDTTTQPEDNAPADPPTEDDSADRRTDDADPATPGLGKSKPGAPVFNPGPKGKQAPAPEDARDQFAERDAAGGPRTAAQLKKTTKTHKARSIAKLDSPKAAAKQTISPLDGLLQITELLPDSTNVNGSDGYEYVEVHNPTDQSVSMADFDLRYLYPAADFTIDSAAVWRLSDPAAQIPAGQSLIVWIKNGANDDKTTKDFTDFFNSRKPEPTEGEDPIPDLDPDSINLVTTSTGGMANGSPRGMEIRTKSGTTVNRVFYNMNGANDVAANQGIQYAYDPDKPATGVLIGHTEATPTRVAPEQVPTAPLHWPADASAPVIDDRTPKEFAADEDAVFRFTVTDDVLTRKVTLRLKSNADQDFTAYNLVAEAAGGQESGGQDGGPAAGGSATTYTFTVPKADLLGKRSFDYELTAGDGAHEAKKAGTAKVAGANDAPLRLNLEDGQFVSGPTRVAAAGDGFPGTAKLRVTAPDGKVTDLQTESELEREPMFVFEASQTDDYFRNGVVVDGKVVNVFDRGLYSDWGTIETAIPLEAIKDGKLPAAIYAGTKAKTDIDPDENNDDFVVRNVRLLLPDGRTLRPAGYDDPSVELQMGDSAGKMDFFDAQFELPEDAEHAQAAVWDTTGTGDGDYTVTATDDSGNEVGRKVTVDNTAPQISTEQAEGKLYQGKFDLDAEVTDAGSGLAQDGVHATLDGQDIELPHSTSSLDLAPGKHTFTVHARDELGNSSSREIEFSTPEENPFAELLTPDGSTARTKDARLSAKVTDPTKDELRVEFLRGERLRFDRDNDGAGKIAAASGSVRDADQAEREDGQELTAGQATVSDDSLPYNSFDVEVPQGADAAAKVRVAWEGHANPGARVRLLVWDAEAAEGKGAYVEVAAQLAAAADGAAKDAKASAGRVHLEALVPVKGHAIERDGKQVVRALVQHSVGFSGENLSDRDTKVKPAHKEDTPRDQYDFTLGWETDTQYYNASYPDRQKDIHTYFLDRRAPLNLQYMFHTGDIVDKSKQEYQWENADPEYKRLDDAKLPYGVLAGNHDVDQQASDYTDYARYFGAHRYQGNPWYGESFQDNRGHYDLISAGGNDFLMLYMGWDPTDEGIAWMNEVLKKYPERTAIINMHEFMMTTGGLGPVPQRVMDEVVAKNKNVRMVQSGHYHDAFTRKDQFDDNGDGTPDRTVNTVLFDFQALPEGGQSYLRLQHYDNQNRTMTSRTFSPYLADYDSDDPALEEQHQEFTISYDELGLHPQDKTLTTDSFTADVLGGNIAGAGIGSGRTLRTGTPGDPGEKAGATGRKKRALAQTKESDPSLLARFDKVKSGSTVTAKLEDVEAGPLSWYVRVTDYNGGEFLSDIRTLEVRADEGSDEDGSGGDGSGGDSGDADGNGSAEPNEPNEPGEPGRPNEPGTPTSGPEEPGDEGSGSDGPGASGNADGANEASAGDAARPGGSLPVTGPAALGLAGLLGATLLGLGAWLVARGRRRR